MRDVRVAARRVMNLKALGISLSMDDVGAGVLSLTEMVGLPVDALKIDVPFVRGMNETPGTLRLVKAILGLGHSLGMDVIAEARKPTNNWSNSDSWAASVGDQILLLFREHLAQHLKEDDRLIRWPGPVFLAVLDRPNLADGVRAEVKRVTIKKLETTVQIGNRFVLLPVSSSSLIISLLEGRVCGRHYRAGRCLRGRSFARLSRLDRPPHSALHAASFTLTNHRWRLKP